MKKKYIVLPAIIAVIILYFVLRSAFHTEKVKAIQVKRGSLITLIYATGNVTADSVAQLRSESGGIVKFIAAKEGSYVKKGSLLLKTDQKDEMLRIRDVQNQIEQSEIELAAKKRDLERKETLYKTRSITEKDLEDARQNYELAQVALRQKRISLDEARQKVENTEITAPFTGLLVSVKVNLGDYLTPNAECFEILAPNSILVMGEVDEQDLGKIKKGMPSAVAFDAYPGEKFDGTVERITPKTDQTTKTSKVYIRLSGSSEKLNIGMTATINIKAGEKQNVLLIPRTAVFQESSAAFIFAVNNNVLKKIKIPDAAGEGMYIEIPDGMIPEGTMIVDQPKSTLKGNMKVEVS
ncbi:MAG: efflux RND transporter periplasmic adaptor subunit [Syntrophothermus sp.]